MRGKIYTYAVCHNTFYVGRSWRELMGGEGASKRVSISWFTSGLQMCKQFLFFFFFYFFCDCDGKICSCLSCSWKTESGLFNTTLMSLGMQAKPTCSRKNVEGVGNGFITGKIFTPRQEIDLGIHWPRGFWACLLLIYWTPLLYPSDSSNISKKAAECCLHLCHCEPSRRHWGVTRTFYLLVGILDLKEF